ncbi:MAG TPA: hypothetical protein VFJ23_05325, partial [Candidatus Nitrosotalea sp.]|nr:hypothetical protein [Candidatus Nitrosotalea sp.]
IGLPLYTMSNSSQGIAFVQNDKFGMETKVYDDHHLLLTMYKGNTTTGTIIAAMATNISSEKIIIQNFGLGGSYYFSFDNSGSETPLLQVNPIIEKDSSVSSPTLPSPIVLEPHQSITAYVNGTFVTRGLSLNKFSASVGYDFNESNKTNSFSVSDQFLNVKS